MKKAAPQYRKLTPQHFPTDEAYNKWVCGWCCDSRSRTTHVLVKRNASPYGETSFILCTTLCKVEADG